MRCLNRWIPVVVSKIFRPKTSHTHAHAYASGPDPRQGLRQQAFLQSIGIGAEVPVTLLCDGGADIGFGCKLQTPPRQPDFNRKVLVSAAISRVVDTLTARRSQRRSLIGARLSERYCPSEPPPVRSNCW